MTNELTQERFIEIMQEECRYGIHPSRFKTFKNYLEILRWIHTLMQRGQIGEIHPTGHYRLMHRSDYNFEEIKKNVKCD